MRKTSILAFALFAATASALPAGVLAQAGADAPASVYFEPDTDVVTPAAAQVLDEVARQYAATTNKSVNVSGHGDSGEVTQYAPDGDSYCVGLSQRRASNVRTYLAEHGVPDGVITTEAFGCSRPASEGASGASNRRVEILITEGTGW